MYSSYIYIFCTLYVCYTRHFVINVVFAALKQNLLNIEGLQSRSRAIDHVIRPFKQQQ